MASSVMEMLKAQGVDGVAAGDDVPAVEDVVPKYVPGKVKAAGLYPKKFNGITYYRANNRTKDAEGSNCVTFLFPDPGKKGQGSHGWLVFHWKNENVQEALEAAGTVENLRAFAPGYAEDKRNKGGRGPAFGGKYLGLNLAVWPHTISYRERTENDPTYRLVLSEVDRDFIKKQQEAVNGGTSNPFARPGGEPAGEDIPF